MVGITSKFWTNIKIKVNTSVKEATTESELALLLSLLGKSTYSGLRDSIVILLLYKTGIRIKTLGALREQNIDFENMLLKLQGEIMKSHRPLVLPLDDEMCTLLRELISINDDVRKEQREKNDYIFLSNIGVPISNTVSPSNLIAKNLWVYSKKWNLKNVNPHSIRRLYEELNIPINLSLEIAKLELFYVIDENELPEHLKPYIAKESIKEHNSLVDETNIKIEKYNGELERYKRAIDTGIEYEITLCNNGKAKATNIFVDMYFPEEVEVIEGGIDDLTEPEVPELRKDLLQVAEEKYYKDMYKFPADNFSSLYAKNALFGGIQLNKRIFEGITSNNLVFNNNYYVSFSSNELTVKCSSLLHTRERTFSEKFLLVPKKVGEFNIEVNAICEEYTDAITREIAINLYEESLKA